MLDNTYETHLKTADLHKWLDQKKSEKIGFLFKFGKYKTVKTPCGFEIEKVKSRRSLVMPPRVKANMAGHGKLQVAIRPNFAGMAVFPAFWLLVMCMLVFNTKRNYASLAELFFATLFVTFLIGIVGHISVTWPVFDARKWIERELDLQRQTA